MVALTVDPICQGERFQILKQDGTPATRGGTTTHTLFAAGAMLAGTSTVAYEAWDNIRSLDYLISRPEVIADKIGCTGTSGGGTQTHFLMALDDRIAVAAPSCAQADRGRTSCGCQILAGVRAAGIRPSDYSALFAPKPLLMLAGRKDYIRINSVRRLYHQVKDVYTALGHADCVDLFESEDKHGLHKSHRQAVVRWMRRWFLNDNEVVVEPDSLIIQKDEDLWVTGTGQVGSNWKNVVNVAELNLERARQLSSEREKFRKEHTRDEYLAEIKRLIGIRDRRCKPVAKSAGTIQRKGYCIEKIVIHRKGEVPVPGLLFLPEGKPGRLPAVLYVDGRGKSAAAGPDGPIARLVSEGRVVLAIDVRGFGETADDPEGVNRFGLRRNAKKYWNNEYGNAFDAIVLGRPLLGQRVEDILAAFDVLAARKDVNPGSINLTGIGHAGPVALHAAALDSRIAGVTIQKSIKSWVEVVAAPLSHDNLTHVVPFALTRYDLPDLVQAISPGP
ncbi:MAG: metalloendopeptidase, partial [Gemmatimonadota bacterium]|nr:metalloendopeptidase [Gemmatimonadota bacterium]